MKLTKAQRLFVAIGHADERIQKDAVYLRELREHKPEDKKHLRMFFKQRLKHNKARRKRLIREALEAWKVEETAAHNEGYREGIYDN